MSGPKTVALPPKEAKVSVAQQQSSPPPAKCCENIREAAYYKWKAAGCPWGDGVEFWLKAEAELIAETPARRQNERDVSHGC